MKAWKWNGKFNMGWYADLHMEGGTYVGMYKRPESMPHQESVAIAQLIATAPELLEALKSLMTIENKNWPNYVRSVFADARAIIAKATIASNSAEQKAYESVPREPLAHEK